VVNNVGESTSHRATEMLENKRFTDPKAGRNIRTYGTTGGDIGGRPILKGRGLGGEFWGKISERSVLSNTPSTEEIKKIGKALDGREK